MPALKILVYDDNPGFGGHQVMACRGIEALAADPSVKIVCMINRTNQQLLQRLSGFRTLRPADCFNILDVDQVLCIQGDLAQSLRGVRAARRAGIECVSYLALPHRLADMGARLGALRDRMHRHLPNAADRYIVISEGMKRLLLERGCAKPIDVVPNGIPVPLSPKAQDPRPRALSIGLLGRIEFRQKRQDFMVRVFSAHPEVFGGCRLLIAGGGPNEGRLRKMVAGSANIELLPWQDDADAFFKRIDVLAIPSRYEGVPLVMLEALARGIPVIGSDRDGMRDLLPQAWTFEPESAASLLTAFHAVRKDGQSDIGTLQEKVRTEHSLEAFRVAFARAVLK